MTPDDMEAVVRERLAEIDASDAGSPCRQAYFSPAVIRALLLDYQERGRALEALAADATRREAMSSRALSDHTRTTVFLGDLRRARATLKGKSHD